MKIFRQSLTALVLATAFALLSTGNPSVFGQSREIGFVEDFVLSSNREKTLEKLIPGTEAYYYFHCLHLQNSEKYDQVDAMVKDWVKRHGRSYLVRQIQNRQALLTYEQNPQKTLDYLKKELGLRFDHQREIPKAELDLPTRLDPSLISYATLAKDARSRHLRTEGFTDTALFRLASEELNDRELKHLLERLRAPDAENLVDLVDRQLSKRDARAFGSLGIHRAMTVDQLDALLKKRPSLLNETRFVQTYLSKLKPNEDEAPALAKIDYDEPELEAYLKRVSSFVERLAPVHNSLKASVLYHRLKFNLYQGKFDRELFESYIKLPRHQWYVNPKYIKSFESKRNFADINARFTPHSLLPPVGNDAPLIESHLREFYKNADDWKLFSRFLEDNFLKRQFAQSKIIHGLGDPEQWASLLGPEEYKALVNRIDLDFPESNARKFAVDQTVKLDVKIKNVNHLLIKVFEINTKNFYQKYGREIDTDINLDGLVPNWEQNHRYDDAPSRQVRRTFEFKELNKPGVYVIDFIGNGISSRALVRKGHLHFVSDANFAGQQFTVFDWKNEKVKDASIWIGGREFTSQEDGTIQVPFSTNPGRKPVVVSHKGLSSLGFFNHIGESYRLRAGFYVDRESLLKNRIAKVTLRPTLFTSGWPTPISALKNATLEIQSVNAEGITASKVIRNVELSEDFESEFEFGVPARLRSIRFRLVAEVENVSQGSTETLADSQTIEINRIDQSTSIRDLHLLHASDGYRLEVRGKNGTAIVKQAVLVNLQHRMFTRPFQVSLQTDDSGQITLGELSDISHIKATIPGVSRGWSTSKPSDQKFSIVHGDTKSTLQIPVSMTKKISRESVSLFEVRSGVIVRDFFDAIKLQPGVLQVKGLPVGDYQLNLKNENRTLQLSITEGKSTDTIVFGKHRNLEIRNLFPVHVRDIKSDDKNVAIQLGNASPTARVHIFATRYQPRFDAFPILLNNSGLEPFRVNARTMSTSYVVGRNIGDEYRYILERKFARKYAGNMLTRPSLLLRPWSIDETKNYVQPPARGADFDRSGPDPSDMMNRQPKKSLEPRIPGDESNLDFLAYGAAVLTNLKPSESGTIIIDRKLLNGHFNLQIVVSDRVWTSRVHHLLKETPIELADNRLAKAIDPASHYALRKQNSQLREGEEVVLTNSPTSKIQQFDDLGDVYQLLMNMSGNSTLGEFRFILAWPKKTGEEKRELFSKYACHELNFFIYKKDREFFEEVVRPFLANKKDKTFFDQWLLDEGTESYLDPWQYNRLNVAERILLSQRLEERKESVRRNIYDLQALNPQPVHSEDRLYQAVFGTEGLTSKGKSSAGKRILADGKYNRGNGIVSNKPGDGSKGISPPRAGGGAGAAVGGDFEGGGFGGGGFGGRGRPDPKMRNLGRRKNEVEKKLADSLSLLEEKLDDEKLGQVRDRYYKQLQNNGKDKAVKKLKEMRKQLEPLYRRVQPTKVWVETNYYRLPIAQHDSNRVRINEFWKDYAAHDGGSLFLSPNFAQCTRNFTELMLAMAVIDLPFEAKDHKQEVTDEKITFKSAGPVIVFHQQVRPAVFERRGSTVLVSENFFRKDDRYRNVDGKRYDKFVRKDFLKQVLYGGQVVVTNPTSTPKTVSILIQIPEGSMPAAGSQESKSVKIDLSAFSTQTFEYHFFFPEPGTYAHYPAHVSDDDKVLAVAESLTFSVLDQPRKIDKTSWAFISQNGTPQQVLDFLNANNTLNLDLSKIAFRLKEKDFFKKVISTLQNRMTFDNTLWSYAIQHNDADAIAQFLQYQNSLVSSCGKFLDSRLLKIKPIDRRIYEHREFWPLHNARQHQLGAKRQINNPKIWNQYHQFLDVLSYHNEPSDDLELSLTYYLLLQDRVESAIEQFRKVDRSKLNTKMQYDYCQAYLAMYTEDVATAKAVATKYQQYPVDHWRKHFENILTQVAEIESDAATTAADERDRDQVQAQLAAQSPAFEFEIVDQTVKLNYQNIDKVRINYYKMDIELLFSRNPFVKNQSGGFALIRPNMTRQQELPKDKKSFEFNVPKELANHNVLIEIISEGQTKSAVFYSHSLAVKMMENYGQVQVRNKQSQKPISKAYIKVYAKMKDGSVKFYKDGYTDLRGRFDYSSLSNQPLDNVQQFSLLILSEANGAIIRQAGLPLQ